MRNTSFLVFLLTVVLAMSMTIAWVGCGDDDDDDDDSSADDDDDNGPDVGDKGKISGCIHDFQSGQGLLGATIELVNNDTGESLGITKTTTTSDGCVELTGISTDLDFVGVKVTKDGYKDTYQFYFDNGITGEEFLAVAESTATLVAAALNIAIEDGQGFAAGGLYWGDPTEENPIGCAKIEFDQPSDGVFYFFTDKLPNLSRNITGNAPSDGEGTNPAGDLDQAYSLYVSVNQDPGPTTATATIYDIEDDEAGTGSTLQESIYLPMVAADAVCIANIYFPKGSGEGEYDSNPTPAWCTE